jgi:methionyl-tRNA formyltransferase
MNPEKNKKEIENIIFYGRERTGLVVLLYLLAKGYKIKTIPEDKIIEDISKKFDLETTSLSNLNNEEFDLLVCCHGKRIIKGEYLKKDKFVNIHPCLFKYKGQDPIARYLKNKDTQASVESHYMIEEVDAGEIIISIHFDTPKINSHGEFYNLALPYYLDCIHETMSKVEERFKKV